MDSQPRTILNAENVLRLSTAGTDKKIFFLIDTFSRKNPKVGPILFWGVGVEIERCRELHCRRLLLTSRRRVTERF
ncbi:hypothetical protein CEXT_805991 [Caerostris extrusa]|uniref:Uncharacterized protein n=1 Tax=Caerostris extrusa TaxID=172846 RepID=A0AAV4X436_CAEEX|nr:hypothetical protein CEXT_805991 [Caerostris extrusa]